jgi:hypothetical protein
MSSKTPDPLELFNSWNLDGVVSAELQRKLKDSVRGIVRRKPRHVTIDMTAEKLFDAFALTFYKAGCLPKRLFNVANMVLDVLVSSQVSPNQDVDQINFCAWPGFKRGMERWKPHIWDATPMSFVEPDKPKRRRGAPAKREHKHEVEIELALCSANKLLSSPGYSKRLELRELGVTKITRQHLANVAGQKDDKMLGEWNRGKPVPQPERFEDTLRLAIDAPHDFLDRFLNCRRQHPDWFLPKTQTQFRLPQFP